MVSKGAAIILIVRVPYIVIIMYLMHSFHGMFRSLYNQHDIYPLLVELAKLLQS